MQVRGSLFVLCAAVLWALIGPLSRQALATHTTVVPEPVAEAGA